ncbi:acyl-CoA desaturase [Thiohalorhabdus sp.]|uniref:acyl-CoA desaturase n=1 Tax=Thiohalorhabdus sp. TaxID=3094134 RepID=UPI002FC3B35A
MLARSWTRWLVGDGPGEADPLAGGPVLTATRWAGFVGFHLACLGVIWVGISATAVAVAGALYLLRMGFITAFYHRYFSHRAFRTSRLFQFLMALAGCTAAQRGPLWWAGHHRRHHAQSDGPGDVHSPVRVGFFRSHMGWFLAPENYATPWRYVSDWRRYPELVWLNRLEVLPVVALAASLYGLGEALANWAPAAATNGPQLLVWGFVVSTVAVYHGTYTINSLAHLWGFRRFATADESRNNALLALLTLGEGWHNNHHYAPGSASQGFRWWELDITWLVLRGLAAVGLIWDLRPVPQKARQASSASAPLSGRMRQ